MAPLTNDNDLLVTAGNLLERSELKWTQLALTRRLLVNRLCNLNKLTIRAVADCNEVDFGISKMTREDLISVIDKAIVNGIFENTPTVAAAIPIQESSKPQILNVEFATGLQNVPTLNIKSARMLKNIGLLKGGHTSVHDAMRGFQPVLRQRANNLVN